MTTPLPGIGIQRSGWHLRALPLRWHTRIGKQPRQQLPGFDIHEVPHRFAIDALDQAARHAFPVDHEWPHALGIEQQVQQVARLLADRHVNEAIEETGRRLVRQHDIPVAVQHTVMIDARRAVCAHILAGEGTRKSPLPVTAVAINQYGEGRLKIMLRLTILPSTTWK